MMYILSILEMEYLSINAFCKLSGIGRSHFYKLNRGENRPRIETIKYLALTLAKLDKQPWKIHAQKIKDEFNLKNA